MSKNGDEPRQDERADASRTSLSERPNVDYFYDEHVGNFHYGPGHPMRPHRVRLTHHLIVNYGLYKHLNVFRPKPATFADLTAFHTDEYIKFLSEVTPENMHESQFRSVLDRHNICEDCPIFDGLYEYCQTYTGGSIAGAARVNQGCSDIVINWAGGLHHAKKGEASGFCYANDIVLAILELLKVHSRILYVDIDIHHGDGVEEAFYLTNRVMTLSFHQSGASFFPRTGHSNDVGGKMGKNYAVNFPLLAGMDDVAYESIFKPVIAKTFEMFQPNACVLCCGADSLSGDRVGCWNLSIKGHAAVLDYIKTFNVPMLVFGGGGYTIRNVARCWCYETSRLLNVPISEDVPYHEYMDYYQPEYKLHMPVSNMKNENTREALEATKQKIFEQLSHLEHVPNVQMRKTADALFHDDPWEDDEEDCAWGPDERPHRMRRCHLAEFYDADDGVEGDRMDTDRLNLRDFEEPPDPCSCSGASCTGKCGSAPNPFVAALQSGRNPSR